MRDSAKLRIGILNDTKMASKYVFDLVQWANARDDIEICCLILHQRAENDRKPIISKLYRFARITSRQGLYRAISKVVYHLVSYLELIALRTYPQYRHYSKSFDLSTLVKVLIEIKPIVSLSGYVHRFSEEDIQKVASINADLLLRTGSGILKGGILNASRFGVLSFHHADNRVIRGGPPGFWEVFLRHRTTGFTLQILTEELDGGIVLRRGHFPTKFFSTLNQAYIYERSNHHLKLLVTTIASTGHLPAALPATPYSAKLFRSPTVGETVRYCAGVVANVCRLKIPGLFGRCRRWSVGFLFCSWRDAVLWRGKEIENPPNHFLADPFVITCNDRHYCFVEDFDYATRRAEIAAYELTPAGGVRLGSAIREDFHLSFPYLFKYDGELYMCPECYEAREIRIYRCVNFPLGWVLERVIMRDVSAADTMLFEHCGAWWLFTNVDPLNRDDHTSELYIFFSHSPISDNWTTHRSNPVIVDATSARNAGLLREEDRIFRVSQRQGFELYGEGADVNEILELTSEAYRERALVTMRPGFKPGICGTHHLHSNGRVTVFDYVR